MRATCLFSGWYTLASSELSGLYRGGLSDVRKTEVVSQSGGKAKAVDQAAEFEPDSHCPLSPPITCVVGRGWLPWAVSRAV